MGALHFVSTLSSPAHPSVPAQGPGKMLLVRLTLSWLGSVATACNWILPGQVWLLCQSCLKHRAVPLGAVLLSPSSGSDGRRKEAGTPDLLSQHGFAELPRGLGTVGMRSLGTGLLDASLLALTSQEWCGDGCLLLSVSQMVLFHRINSGHCPATGGAFAS